MQVDPRAFLKVLHVAGENVLIDLSLTDEAAAPVGTRTVIVREIQYDPLQPLPSHIDFYLVSLDRAIAVKVPLEIAGVPEAVATKSATLSQHVHELHVECLPGQIPSRITAEVAGLKIGEALHVRDLAIPAGVTLPSWTKPESGLARPSGNSSPRHPAPYRAIRGDLIAPR